MMRSLMYTISFIACIVSVVTASNVIDLTPANFDDIIGSGKPALVEFFAPWCGHCKTLAPVFEQLADSFSYAKEKVVVAKVDADAHRELGQRFGVTGFPTLKWFNGKPSDPEDYKSGRDLDSLSSFITEKAGLRARVKKGEASAVSTLKDETFDKIVLDSDKDVFVKFYAPWCGHCKTLAPIWEKVAKTFANDKDVVVAKIDAEAETKAAGTYGITSYPQIKFFAKGSKEAVDYEGGRSEKDLVDYINSKAGKHRLAGGALDDNAGRIVELDELAKKLAAATTEAEKEDVYTELDEVVSKTKSKYYPFIPANDSDAKYYAKVFEKLKTNPEYVANEKHRLEAIIGKGNMASDKYLPHDILTSRLDSFTIRINILSAFEVSGKGTPHEEL